MPGPALASLGGLTLSYLALGTGEPVLLVHAGVLAEAGHMLMLEQPRAAAEALAAFLGRHPM